MRRDPQRAEGARPVRLDAVVRGDGVDVRLAAAPQEGRLQGLVHAQLARVAAPAAHELDLAVRQRARVDADVEGLAAEGAQRHARRVIRGLATQVALHRDVAHVDGGGRDRELVAMPRLELLERVVDAVHSDDRLLAARVDLDLERGPLVDGALEPLVPVQVVELDQQGLVVGERVQEVVHQRLGREVDLRDEKRLVARVERVRALDGRGRCLLVLGHERLGRDVPRGDRDRHVEQDAVAQPRAAPEVVRVADAVALLEALRHRVHATLAARLRGQEDPLAPFTRLADAVRIGRVLRAGLVREL